MKQFFKFLNTNVSYILLGIIAVLISFLSIEKIEKSSLKNNLIVTKDSVKYYKNKAGESYAQVQTYIVTNDQLKQVNKELYNEVNKYKNQKPIVVVSEKVKIEYRDTLLYTSISSKLDKFGNKEFTIDWSADTIVDKDNYVKLNGLSYLKIDSMLNIIKYGGKLTDFQLGAKLFLGVNEDKSGKLVINARTDFPWLSFTDMEGYIIDPMKVESFKKLVKKKRYGVSGFGGVGTYFEGGGIKFIPTVGVGFTYDFFQF